VSLKNEEDHRGQEGWKQGPKQQAQRSHAIRKELAKNCLARGIGSICDNRQAASGYRATTYRPDWFLEDTLALRARFIREFGPVRWTILHGAGGLEAWAGTPGTVGGAIYGNAHYGGRNIGDLVLEVGLAGHDGQAATVPRLEMEFAYDTSRLKRTGEIAVWADFGVAPASPEALRLVARRSLAHRKGTQPLAYPSAGCMFQNPDPVKETVPEGIPPSAGALIDRAGLKGHRIGGATISPVHANFFVSDGTATAADIRALAELARATVRSRFGVELRDEIMFLGRF
jgi:UDP-N-acetylmuramate dehydrogenase